jgi:hypothetical protein
VGVVPKDKRAKIDKLMKEYDEKCVKALKLRIQSDKMLIEGQQYLEYQIRSLISEVCSDRMMSRKGAVKSISKKRKLQVVVASGQRNDVDGCGDVPPIEVQHPIESGSVHLSRANEILDVTPGHVVSSYNKSGCVEESRSKSPPNLPIDAIGARGADDDGAGNNVCPDGGNVGVLNQEMESSSTVDFDRLDSLNKGGVHVFPLVCNNVLLYCCFICSCFSNLVTSV